MKTPLAVHDAIEWYGLSLPATNRNKDISNLKTTLKKCVLTGYGFERSQLQTKAGLHECLSQLSLSEFRKAKLIFQKVAAARVEAGEISIGTVKNYSSELNRFLLWLRQQDWYESASAPVGAEIAPTLYSGYSTNPSSSSKKSSLSQPYSLKVEEYPSYLNEEIALLEIFWTIPIHPHRDSSPLRQTSIKTYLVRVNMFLGWIKNVYLPEIEATELHLELMTQVDLVKEFVAWGLYKRENSYTWALQVVKAALFVTKWWESIHPKTTTATSDILVAALGAMGLKPTQKFLQQYSETTGTSSRVAALRAYQRSLQQIAHKRQLQAKAQRTDKLLSFEQLCEVVEYLKQCCAPNRIGGHKRSVSVVRSSYQKYILIKFLTYCPIRQREIRELELGKTLWRETERYVVKLASDDHKTGSKTGMGREFPIPDVLTGDLDEWLSVWRKDIETAHGRVFISLGGNKGNAIGSPLTDKAIHSLVTGAMKRATHVLFGEVLAITPHDFRRIAITHHRQVGDASQTEALATLMGHSVKEAEEIYNHMTPREKAQKALFWWQPSSSSD